MKKNLLFALTVFLLTIFGLLVFCDNHDTDKSDTIENHQLVEDQDEKAVVQLRK